MGGHWNPQPCTLVNSSITDQVKKIGFWRFVVSRNDCPVYAAITGTGEGTLLYATRKRINAQGTFEYAAAISSKQLRSVIRPDAIFIDINGLRVASGTRT